MVGASCAEVAQAAAIIVAMAIDPNRSLSSTAADAARSDETESKSAPAAPPVSEQNHTAARVPETQPPPQPSGPSSAISLLFRGVGGITVGSLPRPALGGFLLGGVQLDRTTLLLQAGLVGHQRSWRGSVGGAFTLTTAGVLGCHDIVDQRIWIGPCGTVELDWFHAEGLGVSLRRSPDRVVVYWGGGIDSGIHLTPRWAVVIQGLLLAPLQRPSFQVDGQGVVYRPDDRAERLSAAIQLKL